ncbi:hypothetical protein PIB30_017454 [Stylosanthes scabra]|uniref:Uncharacterized protein n=1 Tax=Stylosanthes scabra TaxID=79078 RepID=A0ABU6Y4P4_9FABA|nr:hypothetical protein [Stylosanthes scabra]
MMQIGLEKALVAKTKAEEELLAAQDQVALLKAERDSAMAYLPLKEKVDALNDDLSVKEGERQSALERVSRLEEDIKVMQTELKSCRASLGQERGRAEAAEKKVEELSSSLQQSQFDLGAANETSTYWCTEWKKLATDAKEMCQETLEIELDQVSHLCPGVDFSAISLKSCWDPKGRRIYVPEGASGGDVDMAKASPVVDQEQQLAVIDQVPQSEVGEQVVGAPGDQSGEVPWCLFRPLYGLPFGIISKP